MFLQIDGTLVVQVINFVLFIVLLNIVFLKPVGTVIAKRRAYLDGLARDIEAAEADVKSTRSAAEDRRAAARRETEAALAKARAEAQNEAATVAGEYQQRAAAIAEDARRAVDAEIAAARKDEPRIVASLADSMLDRAVGSGSV